MLYTDDEKQLVLNWVSKKKTAFLPKTAINQLNKSHQLSSLRTKQILQSLYDEGLITSTQNSISYGKLSYTGPNQQSHSEQRWKNILASAPDNLALLPNHKLLSDWSDTELKQLLSNLQNLRKQLPEAYQLTCYEASAQFLLGSSKLLESLDKKSLNDFGINIELFQKPVSYVVIAGPEIPEQVILIENPQSFEACIRNQLHEQVALICTFGYGLQLSQAIQSPDSVVNLVRAGSVNLDFSTLLHHQELMHWGDLDYEGIKIYQAIHAQYPNCLLSNLYLPMINRLKCRNSHGYYKSCEKEGQRPLSGFPQPERAVDQEALSDHEIKENYRGGMSLNDLRKHLTA